MKNLERIVKEVAYRKNQFLFNGIEPRYLFVSKLFLKDMKIYYDSLFKNIITEKEYYRNDRFMGLDVIGVSGVPYEFISVGV